MQCNLDALGEKYNPSKRFHDYLKHYSTHLRDRREDVKKILEIGVQTDRSVNMWREYFPNAVIHGLDIDPKCKSFESDRIRIHIADQGNRVSLEKVLGEIGKDFDLIIDDGSHIPKHQILSFKLLYPALSSHGMYVLEDTGPYIGDKRFKVIKSLLPLIYSINYWPPKKDARLNESYKGPFPKGASWNDRNTVGIAFYRWIVFIMRGNNPDDNKFIQQY